MSASAQPVPHAAEDPAPKTASTPFNKPNANVIIRSSDGVDFYCQKTILAEASPVFDGMFTLRMPPANPDSNGCEVQLYRDGIPVVQVVESSQILDILLRLCYPVANPKLTGVQIISHVLEAARKYLMESLAEDLHALFMARTEEEPFQAYAIAAIHGWKPEMIHAAHLSLRLPFPAGMYIPDMVDMSLQDYVRLQRYHEQCRAVCGRRLIQPDDDHPDTVLCSPISRLGPSHRSRCFMYCTREKPCTISYDPKEKYHSGIQKCSAPRWFKNYVMAVLTLLQKDPRKQAVLDSHILSQYIGHAQSCCKACASQENIQELTVIHQLFADQIQKFVSEDVRGILLRVSILTMTRMFSRSPYLERTYEAFLNFVRSRIRIPMRS